MRFWEPVKPVLVAAGFKHAAVVAVDLRGKKQLFMAGLNSTGQLGLSNTQDELDFKRIKTFSKDDVLDVACGRSHTVVRTSHGVYASGGNSHGQLGRENTARDRTVFIRINQLGRGDNVAQIACGWDHTAFLVAGKVLTCGWAADGQTGHGHTQHNAVPTPVVGLPEITSISSHSDTTLAMGADGSVWAWGNSEYGQTGIPDAKLQVVTPAPLPIPPHTFTRVFAGGSCSIGLHKDGSLSLISTGPLPATTAAVPDADLPWPRLRPAVRVVDVAVGGDYFYLIHANGTATSIGKTQWGVQTTSPLTLALPDQPRQIACAFDRVFVNLKAA